MNQVAKIIASCGGIGYIEKGAGTLAALLLCFLWYWIPDNRFLAPAVIIFIFFLGVWASRKVEPAWGHDSNRIVVDEFMGMGISLIWLPSQIMIIIIGFLLFRFFDILKPLGIRKMETLPYGWGVMGDDLLAGIYANLVLQILLFFDLLK